MVGFGSLTEKASVVLCLGKIGGLCYNAKGEAEAASMLDCLS